MNILSLAWRNTVRSFPRRWPVVIILASAVAVLEVGNTLFESATEGLERTYVRSFASSLTISARSNEDFTIFGNELPLIGEYQVLPVLPDASKWLTRARSIGARAIGQVTAGGVLGFGGWSKPTPVFGVDFADYFGFFPDLKVVRGALPEAGRHSLVMNEVQYGEATRALGSPPPLGALFTLTVFNNNSFTIREVSLAAVYRYPIRDDVLDRIVLVDPDTARALNGYIYGAAMSPKVEAQGSSAQDLDMLFETSSDVVGTTEKGISEKAVADKLADGSARHELNTTVEGSWNFVLTQPGPPGSKDLMTNLGGDSTVQVRGWRDTVGGNALVVWLLQVLFNVGLVFVTAAAALVGINGLSLSVAERTQELGTLRALGATRSRVAALVTVESLLLVTGAGLLGVGFGAATVVWVSAQGLAITNPFLQALFGSGTLRPSVSIAQILLSVTFSLVLGLASIVVPVRRALNVAPVAAMERR